MSATNSTKGSYNTTTEAMMRAYDKLPKTAREALADADRNYVPQPLLTLWRRGNVTAYQLAANVKRWDLMNHSSKAMARDWGAGHPQAIAATQKQISAKERHK